MKDYIPYILIAALLAFIFITRWGDYFPEKKRTVEVDSTSTTNLDSTTVDFSWILMDADSVRVDTVYKEIEVGEPDSVEETDSVSTRAYHNTYKDSLIHARWTTVVAGTMLKQDFWYVPRAFPVRQKTVTNWQTTTTTIAKTITITEQPNGYMTAGWMAAGWADRVATGPTIGFTSPRGDHFNASYDMINQGIVVTGEIRISFRKLLGF